MIANNLKEIRLKNNLKQEDISNILNVKRNTYGYWENGTTLIPLTKLDELAIYYETSLSYLLGDEKYIKCKLKPLNYQKMYDNLLLLKIESRKTYNEIGEILGINSLLHYLDTLIIK